MNHSEKKQEKGPVRHAEERLKDKTQRTRVCVCVCVGGGGGAMRGSALITLNFCTHPGRV